MSKKYYWIKLRTDFFDLETIDWLISQKNGCEYVVLYQKLCLLTANKGGELSSAVGEIIVPYDAGKIARDTKFSFDTVVVALELFKKIGLIYEQENGILKIPYVADIVGSETDSAGRMRKLRASQSDKNVTSNVTDVTSQCNIDIEKDIELDIESDSEKETENVSDKPTASVRRKPAFKIFGEYRHIKLTQEQYDRLVDDYSEKKITEYITKMDEWIQLKGKNPYKDFNLAIRKWLNRDNIAKGNEKNGKSDGEYYNGIKLGGGITV